MKKCLNCNLNISGNISECPLCQNTLNGKKSVSVFPSNTKRKKDDVLFKILIFISVIISGITVIIEYYLSSNINWSLFIILGLLTAIVSIYFMIINFDNVVKMISKYFILLLILLFVWFIATRNLIITTYIIPITCIVMLTFNSIVLAFLKDYYKSQYISTLFTDIIIGFIPLILILTNLTTNSFIAVMCIFINIVIIISLFIFFKKELLSEIEKRFTI